MRSTPRRLLLTAWAVALLGLVACGGSSSNDAPNDGIGAAGGTVTAADGARVVVPAGALTQTTDVAIAAGSAGSPVLPAGTTAVGAVYALTPHGTTFSSPATVTVPFDLAQVPAGTSVQLLKTNSAQTGWETVAGGTVSGSTVSAPLHSFSWVVPVAAAAATGGLSGNWTSLYNCETADGEPFSGEDTLEIDQPDAQQVSFTVSDGSTGTGTLAGDIVTWSSAGPGYTETGTWTILSAVSMVKRSTYVNTDGSGGGTCAGSIHRDS